MEVRGYTEEIIAELEQLRTECSSKTTNTSGGKKR